jgi:hypothetical protein
MEFNELREKYKQRAIQHSNEWREDVSDHIIDVIISVMMTRDDVLQGGGFVQAICQNDLRNAVGRADSDCIKHLKLITMAYSNAYVEQLDYNF